MLLLSSIDFPFVVRAFVSGRSPASCQHACHRASLFQPVESDDELNSNVYSLTHYEMFDDSWWRSLLPEKQFRYPPEGLR